MNIVKIEKYYKDCTSKTHTTSYDINMNTSCSETIWKVNLFRPWWSKM